MEGSRSQVQTCPTQVDFPELKQDQKWPQCRSVFQVLLADTLKVAPMALSDAELDVEPDCSFFSSSLRGLSRIQPYLLDLPSGTSAEHFAKQESERVTYVQQSVIERRLSLIQCEQHVVQGLYVACLLVTLQCFEAPDCSFLVSSGLLNIAHEQKLQGWLQPGSKGCPLTACLTRSSCAAESLVCKSRVVFRVKCTGLPQHLSVL